MTGDDQAPAVTLEVHHGNPTEVELAALIAVVSEAYAQEAAAAIAEDDAPSAWSRTQRPLRTPLRRDVPWGRFAG